MCKSLMFFLAFLVIVPAFALGQITVNNNFQPSPGTIIQSLSDTLADSVLYNAMTAGSGGPMTWDFSSRVYGNPIALLVVSLASAPRNDSFPGATFVFQDPASVDTNWAYEQSNSSVFTSLGFVDHSPNGEVVIVYHNIAPDWVFPISLNSQWISHRTWREQTQQVHTDIFDTTLNTANAWGTIIYHANSVPCLRVMSHKRLVENTFNSNDSLLFSFTSDQFDASFIGAGFFATATVSKFVSLGQNTYSSSASSNFVGATGVTENDLLPKEIGINQNYPNPFNAQTTLTINGADRVAISIFNIAGELIATLQTTGGKAEWDASAFPSGVYFAKIAENRTSKSIKLIMIK